MGEYHCFQVFQRHGELVPVEFSELSPPLKQSTVNEKFKVSDVYEVFGAGDYACSS